MRAIQNTAFGDTSETLKLKDVPDPHAPGAGEVLVGVEYAPINFNDLFLHSGTFALRLDLPSFGGNEGVGKVLSKGASVTNVNVGDRVSLPLFSWSWRERLLIPAADLFALPANADPKQLAMLRINPTTAALILSEYAELKKGDWVIQNAANSGVGRSLIAIAKSRGFKTINLVRRESLISELKATGADEAMLDDEAAPQKVAAIVGKAGVKLGVDGISGPAMGRVVKMLSSGAHLVAYAPMAEQPSIGVSIFELLFRNISLHGFFLGDPYFQATYPVQQQAAVRESAALIASGKINVPIVAVYSMSAIREAVIHAKRGGKVLLDMQAKN